MLGKRRYDGSMSKPFAKRPSTKRTRYLRNYSGKRRISSNSLQVVRNPAPLFMPPVLETKLTYAVVGIETSDANESLESNVYRMNAPFDPDLTGTGTQALGFSQLAALYDQYLCVGVAWELNASTTSTTGGNMVLTFGISATPYTALADAIAGYGARTWKVQSGGGQVKAKGYLGVAKILGTTKDRLYAEESYGSATTTVPAQGCFGILYWQGDPDASTKVLDYTLKLTFYTRFYQLKQLTQTSN